MMVEFDVTGFPALDMTAAENAGKPWQVLDGYIEYPGQPTSPVVVRPAWVRLSSTQIGSGTTGGLTGLVYQFRKLDGTERTLLICRSGVYYVDSWTTPSIAEALSAAVLAAAAVTVDASAVLYAVTFNNQVVISDGVNTPWMWDGTVGGGITKLTNAPVAYGPPTVYYARLFFIKGTDRGAIVWSEVNAANTGYEAGGYNNAWTLGQTGSEPLVAVWGTNEALYYFRSVSWGQIRGAVTTTFSTTGTHDAGDGQVGLLHPAALCDAGGALFFADVRGRPWRLPRGGRPEPIWEQLGVFMSGAATTVTDMFNGTGALTLTAAHSTCEIAHREFTRHVLVRYPGSSATVVFGVDSGTLVGWESSGSLCRLGTAAPLAQPRCVVALTTNRTAVAQGGAYIGPNGPLLFQDQFGTTGSFTSYDMLLFGCRHGYNRGTRETAFEDVDVVWEYPELANYAYTLGASYIDSTQTAVAVAATELTAGVTTTATSVVRNRHVARFGFACVARWMALRLRVAGVFSGSLGTTTADRVAVCGYTITGFTARAVAGVS